ncbi:hypothetical protein AX17_006646 [Amanita inopinata Kibby_2008]|nr:hypothetical protein AX17_006646 [Amanita inopinata Kibby_2008]
MAELAAFLFICLVCGLAALPVDSAPTQAVFSHNSTETPQVGWYDPRINGGRFLDYTNERFGEPLNVIISGLSDPFVLTDFGFAYYTKSLGYSAECLGLHYGDLHGADLGDGDGIKLEQVLARQYYFPIWGTCWESLAGKYIHQTSRCRAHPKIGGHHFRAWKQNGTLANSGAWFIGASKEEARRDWLVDRAVAGGRWKGKWWKAEVEWRTDLIRAGKDGVNHGIPQDGRVAILTVHRL